MSEGGLVDPAGLVGEVVGEGSAIDVTVPDEEEGGGVGLFGDVEEEGSGFGDGGGESLVGEPACEGESA